MVTYRSKHFHYTQAFRLEGDCMDINRNLNRTYDVFRALKQLCIRMHESVARIDQYYGGNSRFESRLIWLRTWVAQFTHEGITDMMGSVAMQTPRSSQMDILAGAVDDYSAYLARLNAEMSSEAEYDEMFNLLVEIPGELANFADEEVLDVAFAAKTRYQVILAMKEAAVSRNTSIA